MSPLDHTRAVATLFVLLLSLSLGAAVRAEAPGKATTPPSEVSGPELSLGLRTIYSPESGYGGYGLGLDGTYYLHPQLGVGAEVMGFVANYGDEYGRQCGYCVFWGVWGTGFVEGRLFPTFYVSPYARLGAGFGPFKRRDEPHTPQEFRITPAFKAETGVDLHYGLASVRGFVFALPLLPNALNDHPIMGFGFQLGVLL
jgi:hypothetical protein